MFDQERGQYRIHLADLLGFANENEGKFVVIKGDDIQGIFDNYELALKAGYERNGLSPFFVKKIERVESAMYFARDLP